MPLVHKEGKQPLEQKLLGVPLCERTKDFFLVEKRKRLALFFSFLPKEGPALTSLLVLSHIFP
jgi:hypothetical protein